MIKIRILVAACIALPLAASADSVPAATYFLYRTNVTGPGTYTESYNSTGALDAKDQTTAIFTGTPNPSITLTSVQFEPEGALAYGTTYLDYSYQINGPSTASGLVAASVYMVMNARGSGGNYSGSGNVQINGFAYTVCASFPNPCGTLWNGQSVPPISSFDGNVAVELPMSGSISLQADAETDGSTTVFVDPYITVPDGYTITFSDGIGNTPPSSPVPEPSSLVLFGTSLLGAFRAARSKWR